MIENTWNLLIGKNRRQTARHSQFIDKKTSFMRYVPFSVVTIDILDVTFNW